MIILAGTRKTNYLCKILKANLSSSSSSNKSGGTKKKDYSTPHPPKDPPDDYNPLCVEHEAMEAPNFIPAAVFRPFTSNCEKLGPGADKRCSYKNSEYYAYHRYSFVALQRACLKIREERLKGDTVRCIYDYEESDEEVYSSDG